MFNTSPISRKCDITVRTCKLLRHIIALEEIDRNCLQLSYALFVGLIHNSLTFSERDVATALSYRDKNHFGASLSRKTNFKSSIWKWQRRHFRKLLEVARFSLRDVTMAKIVGTNKLPSSPPPLSETQGRSVGPGEKARRKFSSTGERAPGYRLLTNHFQKFKRMPAPDWAQKSLCIIEPNQRTASPEFFSCVRTRRLLSRHTCLVSFTNAMRVYSQGKLSLSASLSRNEGTIDDSEKHFG